MLFRSSQNTPSGNKAVSGDIGSVNELQDIVKLSLKELDGTRRSYNLSFSSILFVDMEFYVLVSNFLFSV